MSSGYKVTLKCFVPCNPNDLQSMTDAKETILSMQSALGARGVSEIAIHHSFVARRTAAPTKPKITEGRRPSIPALSDFGGAAKPRRKA